MKVVKIVIDAVMYVIFLLLMAQFLLHGAVHEWLGIAIGVLFITHNILNYKWYKALFKGKYNTVRIIGTVVNFLLIIAMLCCMISGIFVSQHIFEINNGKLILFGRSLHLVSTAWAFILVSIHLGLHWHTFVGRFGKNKRTKIMLRILAALVCVFGVYLFIDRRFWEELFHLIDFQKEFDYGKSLLLYIVENIALSSVFVGVAHYAKKCIKRGGSDENKNLR